jgi:hypothetical protein
MKGSGDGNLSLRGLCWANWGGLIDRDFEIWLNRAQEVECLSLCELCEGNLEEGLPQQGP